MPVLTYHPVSITSAVTSYLQLALLAEAQNGDKLITFGIYADEDGDFYRCKLCLAEQWNKYLLPIIMLGGECFGSLS